MKILCWALLLVGTGTHSPAETAEFDTLPEQIARAAVLIYRLTR